MRAQECVWGSGCVEGYAGVVPYSRRAPASQPPQLPCRPPPSALPCRPSSPALPSAAPPAPPAGPVLPLKDPTSDMAVIARNGSKLVRDVREKKDKDKSRARFWEMAGSKMGKITGEGGVGRLRKGVGRREEWGGGKSEGGGWKGVRSGGGKHISKMGEEEEGGPM